MKQAFFDSVFITYSLGIIVLLVCGLVGPTDKEFAIQNMASIAGLTVGLLVLACAASYLLKTELVKSPGLWLVTFALTFIASLQATDFSFVELLDEQGTAGAGRLFSGLAHANLGLLPEAIVEVVETIFVAFLATAVAVPAAFILAFFCAKNIMNKPGTFFIYAGLRTILNLTRSIEPLIWAVIFSVWVGIGPFAGMLALMIHSIASLAKQYSEIIEGVDEGPIDGIRATGANKIQVIWFGIVPQVVLPYIAFTFYRWDINVRMATVIGLAGGGGIGTLLIKYQGQAMWPEVGCIILVIAVVVWFMDTASAHVREALR